MQVRVLGPLHVERGPGDLVEIRSGRQRALLTFLATRPGAVVSTEQLIEAVWGLEPPPTARAALQVHLSDLRTALEPDRAARSTGRFIGSTAGGYVLAVDELELDSLVFEREVAEGRACAGRGDHEAAARHFATALSLWRGVAYEDGGDAVAEHAAWMENLRLDVEEEQVASELALGGHRVVVADLERLVAEHPLRERRVDLLARALYRCGRQSESLDVLRRHRDELAETLGLDPAPALQDLEYAILRQDPELGPPTGPPTADGPGARPSAPELVGRDGELTELRRRLDDRLVTVTGPAGVGKSALARRWAHDADPDQAVWYVDLASVDEARHLAATVADALGVRERPFADPVADVVQRLRGAFLVLDDVDRVADEAARFVSRLLDECDVRVRVTARERLGVEGERVVVVGPLPVDHRPGDWSPAARLIVERAGARSARAHDREGVEALATQLDGVPLALELAAARLEAFDARELADALAQSNRLLARARSSGPTHHRSLEAAITWSYDLLSPAARAVFESCAVFAAPFTLEGARAVASENLDATEVSLGLAELVERSFLVREGYASARYRMYTPLQSFGWARLDRSGRSGAVREAHGRYLARVMSGEAEVAGGPRLRTSRRELERSLPDLRRALDWLEFQPDVDLHRRAVAPLVVFWFTTGRLTEGRDRLERAVRRADGAPGPALDVLGGVAFLTWLQGDFHTVDHYLDRALGLTAGTEPNDGVLATRGLLAWVRGDVDEAERCLAAAVTRARTLGDGWRLCRALCMAGHVSWFAGDDESAAARYQECVEVAGRVGNDFFRGVALRGVSVALAQCGREAEAQARSEQSLALAHRLGDRTSLGQSNTFAGLVDLATADPSLTERAADRLRQATAACAETRDLFCLTLSVAGMAEVARRQERWRDSLTLWGWLDAVSGVLGLPLPPVERRRREEAQALATQELGDADAAVATSLGRELDLDGVASAVLAAWSAASDVA